MDRIKQFFTPVVPDSIGEEHVVWEFPEYVSEQKSRLWYVIVSVLLAAVLVYAVLTANYLFVVILLLSVFILIYQYFQPARKVKVVIGQDGIIIDKKFYSYKALKRFWIIYEPPYVKYLYLGFKSDLKPHYPIPLEDINPITVRDHLLNYLEEDFEKEELENNETLSRLMNIR
jgi:hypothetical protein